MDKQELLSAVSQLAAQGQLSREELLVAFEHTGGGSDVLNKKLTGSGLLYYVGGTIVFLGIGIFVSKNWEFLNSLTRIVITLGGAAAMFVAGSLLVREERTEGVGQAFFVVSALLAPLGVSVTFKEAGLDIYTRGMQSVISLILLAFYLGSFAVLKKNLFLLFSIFFGTWFFFAITQFLIPSYSYYSDYTKYYEYRALVVGLSYLLLGYYFSLSDKRVLSGPLYGFGSLALFGAAMALQGFSPRENVFWELIFPFLTVGGILLSTRLKSTSLLVFGSLFLIAYIFKITGEYFANSLGWPIALIIGGFGLIGVAYMTVHLKRKYISQTPPLQ